jgi:Cu/Ag efflux protein CusF
MKFNAILIALLLIAMCACGESQKTNTRATATSPTPVPTTAIPRDGDYPAKGVVTKINTELGSVELNHGDIPGVMPPMLMEFYVSDKKILGGLKVGDNVDFVLRYKHPTETIVQITKAK